jgi:hypothetical protein
MAKPTLLLAGIAALAGPLTAQAADIACATKGITPEYRADLGAAMLADDLAARDRLFPVLMTAARGCAQTAGYTDAQSALYFDVILADVSRGWLTAELAKAGLDSKVIDDAFDFGPTGANPSLDDAISDNQIEAVVKAFIKAGVAVEKIEQKSWEQVGAYAAATAIYWRAMAKLP